MTTYHVLVLALAMLTVGIGVGIAWGAFLPLSPSRRDVRALTHALDRHTTALQATTTENTPP